MKMTIPGWAWWNSYPEDYEIEALDLEDIIDVVEQWENDDD